MSRKRRSLISAAPGSPNPLVPSDTEPLDDESQVKTEPFRDATSDVSGSLEGQTVPSQEGRAPFEPASDEGANPGTESLEGATTEISPAVASGPPVVVPVAAPPEPPRPVEATSAAVPEPTSSSETSAPGSLPPDFEDKDWFQRTANPAETRDGEPTEPSGIHGAVAPAPNPQVYVFGGLVVAAFLGATILVMYLIFGG